MSPATDGHPEPLRQAIASGTYTTLQPEVVGGIGPIVQFRTPYRCEWNRYRLPIGGLHPDLSGLRIAVLTDLHFKPWWSDHYRRLAERVNSMGPDLVLYAGDFVDDKTASLPTIPHVLRFVEAIRGRLGAYAILGNHDGDLVGPYLAKTGVELLDNQVATLRASSGAILELIGVTPVGREDFDATFFSSMPAKPDGAARIVLSHFPDTLRRLDCLRPDVVISGHTHGGQVCLPGGKPIITHDPMPKPLCKGVHEIAGTYHCVSRGLGFSSLPIRVFCPAEVVELELAVTSSDGRSGRSPAGQGDGSPRPTS